MSYKLSMSNNASCRNIIAIATEKLYIYFNSVLENSTKCPSMFCHYRNDNTKWKLLENSQAQIDF